MPSSDPYATATYQYELPADLIAQHPADRRDESRLLVARRDGSLQHLRFAQLGQLLHPDDLLVVNDTKVLPARFFVKRKRGGAAQVLLLHPAQEAHTWLAMARPGKRVRPGDRLRLDEQSGIEILDFAPGGNRYVRFYGIDAQSAMQRFGVVPLPPYIRQPPPDAANRYQTVYAARPGSVAAPTAGLHFTEALISQLKAQGVCWTAITLEVGAGTFRPVKVADIREHFMHAEHYTIREETALAILNARKMGGRIVAVGTTTLRALEDARLNAPDGMIRAGERWTSLFLHPPKTIQAADVLITNFHLPRSTLLMLVCAFAGTRRVLDAYREAVRLRYRFYSFGDAMFLERADEIARQN
jgi:S-adenosylmethionine:tRNA ribosyltransferase-isomerase